MGAMMMVRMMQHKTMRLPTASGFLKSLRIPSLKKVVLSLMTSCWRFSSSVAGVNMSFENLERSIWVLRGFFFSLSIVFPSHSYLMRGSTSLYSRSQMRFATTISTARKIVVAMMRV